MNEDYYKNRCIELDKKLDRMIDSSTKIGDKFKQLQNNWNELKYGLKSLFEFEEGVVSKDYLECAKDTLEKMQELRGDGKN